ncbi:O-antigen ligase family protein [Photobacterium toruni]|uniref:O-antigen ligase family protein n=1 Tax=Photobacterium toruni TaxID=1935446 RepID=A0ABU6L5L5_9GAMM|nr:O-antigen ligase family protein [Photobacterium toruni]
MSYYVIGFICYYYVIGFLRGSTREEKYFCAWITLFFSSLTILIDTVYRFLTPNYAYMESVSSRGEANLIFYAYKHSYIFQDSNFSALVSLLMVCLSALLWKEFKSKIAFYFFLLNSCLVFFSFSRASIGACLVFYILFFLSGLNQRLSKVRYFYIITILLISVLCIIIIHFSNYNIFSSSDGSLQTKFEILYNTIHQLDSGNLFDFFIGWGFNQTKFYMPRSAHNLLITFLLETGIIGLLTFIVFSYQYITKNIWTFLTLTTFLVASMSFGLLISAYMVPLAIIVIISQEIRR